MRILVVIAAAFIISIQILSCHCAQFCRSTKIYGGQATFPVNVFVVPSPTPHLVFLTLKEHEPQHADRK